MLINLKIALKIINLFLALMLINIWEHLLYIYINLPLGTRQHWLSIVLTTIANLSNSVKCLSFSLSSYKIFSCCPVNMS